MGSTCIIYNPAARSEGVTRRIRALKRLAKAADWRATKAAGHASELAEQAAREGYETVVAVGGDGTINEVLNGIMRVPDRRPRLGVIPSGTANVYARDLGLPRDVPAAWQLIEAGGERLVDVGQAKTADGKTRYFAQLAGAGFDAIAIAALNAELKKRIHWLAYVFTALQALNKQLPELTVTAANEQTQGHCVLIGNGRFYGGSFPLFPGSRLDDGLLAVCVFPGKRMRDVVRYINGVICGGAHTKLSDVRFLRAKEIRVEGETAVPVEVDGELWGQTPVDFSIQPGALRVASAGSELR